MLGRIAMVRAAFPEAEAHLTEALQTFTSVEARAEEARTHLALAELARARNDRDGSARHLVEALRRFRALTIPKWAERTEATAREWGVGAIGA